MGRERNMGNQKDGSAYSTWEINRAVDLQGRHALIIGGGRGIGKKIALYYAEAGSSISLVSRSLSELEQVRTDIRKKTQCDVSLFAADATDDASMAKIISGLERLDILVFVAGTSGQVPAEKYTRELFDRIYGLNCHALYNACALSYPLLSKSEFGGRVIAIASHLGVVGLPLRTIYCSSKAAVIHYITTLAAEWAKDHITANCIAPGYTYTELSQIVLHNKAFREEVLSKTPVGFIADTDDIAGAALYLASSASRYMTGQTMVIDGGWSCV